MNLLLKILLAASSAGVLAFYSVGSASAAQPPVETFAVLPPVPGYPEGVAVDGNYVYVSGPARFATAGSGPSAIQVYQKASRKLLATLRVSGENLRADHALSNIAVDGDGRLYALSTQLGLIRIAKSTKGYVQNKYGAPLPDLPICAKAAPPCSPTQFDAPPIVNDIVFDKKGNAYVTDSLQATVFRYPPGGGDPRIWFQSPVLEGGGPVPFGPNGIRLDPQRKQVYFVSTTSLANPNLGTIYRLPLVDAPRQSDLRIFHQYVAGEGPDQLAFAANGHLYVSLDFGDQISWLGKNGKELGRIANPTGNRIPLDAPAGIAFEASTRSLLIANHAVRTEDPAHFAVLRGLVNDPGDPLEKPRLSPPRRLPPASQALGGEEMPQ